MIDISQRGNSPRNELAVYRNLAMKVSCKARWWDNRSSNIQIRETSVDTFKSQLRKAYQRPRIETLLTTLSWQSNALDDHLPLEVKRILLKQLLLLRRLLLQLRLLLIHLRTHCKDNLRRESSLLIPDNFRFIPLGNTLRQLQSATILIQQFSHRYNNFRSTMEISRTNMRWALLKGIKSGYCFANKRMRIVAVN